MRSKFVTDRQTNSLTPYTGGCGFFLQVKFATSLLASLAGDNFSLCLSLCLSFSYFLCYFSLYLTFCYLSLFSFLFLLSCIIIIPSFLWMGKLFYGHVVDRCFNFFVVFIFHFSICVGCCILRKKTLRSFLHLQVHFSNWIFPGKPVLVEI